jgi:hypothetical protein
MRLFSSSKCIDRPCAVTVNISHILLRQTPCAAYRQHTYSSCAWFQASTAKEIGHVLFWVITQRMVIIPYRRFGKPYRIPSSKVKKSKKNALVLEVLTIEDKTRHGVPKRRRGITRIRCVITQLRAEIIFLAVKAGNQTCSYEIYTSQWPVSLPPEILQIPNESPCISFSISVSKVTLLFCPPRINTLRFCLANYTYLLLLLVTGCTAGI